MSTLRAEVLRFVAEAATPRPWKILPIHSLDGGRGRGRGVRTRGSGRKRERGSSKYTPL